MRNLLLSCLVLIIVGCGPKNIPYSQISDTSEPNEAARAHYQWSIEYAKVGDLSQAVTELNLAIELEPHWALLHYNLGSVYGNMGLLDEAISAWERATQLDTDFAKAYYNLAVSYAVKAEKESRSGEKHIFIEKSIVSLRESIRVDKSALTAAQMEEAFDSFRDLSEFRALLEATKPKK